ncbi:calcium-binding protein 7 [Cynoglossus semilaevis]|uniref:Calcium binding protein 7 n=1 Tax=Cynoglossus semilaevis TaxID=244447 RepID=A0A3P8X017_CYNSE|nr:calcium-binding protein 7-like [Cynoglossus semilaevis]
MPLHPVTSLMYRGVSTDPDLPSNDAPLNLPEDELEELHQAFKVFDHTGDGFISKEELGVAMRSLGYMPNEVELEIITKRLDMDGNGQVDFEEFIALLSPKLTIVLPERFNGTDFDSVFWKSDTQKMSLEELKNLLFNNFNEHLSMNDIDNIIMTEENHSESPTPIDVDIDDASPTQEGRQTCVRKSLVCALTFAFIISVLLIATNQLLRNEFQP